MTTPVGTVAYAIEINGLPVKEQPMDVLLLQDWGHHDAFSIRVEYYRTDSTLKRLKFWPDNARVKITWGRNPSNLAVWYGYVNHHEIVENAHSGSYALQVTYLCTGLSKPMNTHKSRTWGQVTPTYIAKKIAEEYQLRAVLSSTDWLLPYEVQGNESDFHFLNRIADKTGYRFWVGGGTLYFIDPAAVLVSSGAAGTPVYTMDKSFTKMDTMKDFHMRQGGNLPGGTLSNRIIYGLEKGSGEVFKVQGASSVSNIFDQISDNHYVTSISEGQHRVKAWQGLSQWWISADALLFGTANLYPGKIIYLQGYQMPQDTTGYWIVSSARHALKKSYSNYNVGDQFVTRVHILRNIDGTVPSIRGSSKVTPEVAPCSTRGGNWVSDNTSVSYDGVTQ